MKYSGKIGIATTYESVPGVWSKKVVEYPVMGDIFQVYKRYDTTSYINDNVVLNNEIDILINSMVKEALLNTANPMADEASPRAVYIIWNNSKWKISSIRYNYPRATVTLGGIWNE